MKYLKLFTITALSAFLGCNSQADQADAYGNFEAIEVLVSAESQGRILSFEPMEGTSLEKDEVVAVIDTLQLHLNKLQLASGEASLNAKIHTLDAQAGASHVQLKNLEREKQRIDNLVEGGAATSKQQDDMKGQIELLKAQIIALESQKASVNAERSTLKVQIRQVEDRIQKGMVRNPMKGILLTKYKEKGEITAPGQSLYKMADLDELILRAYVSGNQLSEIKTGKAVRVRFDVPGGMDETGGVVSWISPMAEFTPKIIQTKEERVNLVYAIKVVVSNDGSLKIGMPGEVFF
ncbi:MAG: HlyD family efflux transporter periplasmic adaptor subunit [Bacteroidota bacterium]